MHFRNESPIKIEHIRELGGVHTLEQVALLSKYSFSFFDEDKLIACAGLVPLYEGSHRALIWSLLAKGGEKYLLPLTRCGLRLMRVSPFKRIEGTTPCDFPEGHRWLRMLGFEMEAECMRNYQLNKDHSLYSRIM